MPRSCGQQASLEKAEIVGDAYLKFAATLYLFREYPKAHVGAPLVENTTLEQRQPKKL